MKKIILILIPILIILTYFCIIRIDKNSNTIGKWKWKYTYLKNGKLHYTEEDGMESYTIFYKNNTYKSGDHNSDVTNKGLWFETKNKIILFFPFEVLIKQNDGTIKTKIKNGKKVLFDHDFYNVLVKG